MLRTHLDPEHEAFRELCRLLLRQGMRPARRAVGAVRATSTARSGARPAPPACCSGRPRRSSAARGSRTTATRRSSPRRCTATGTPASASACRATSCRPTCSICPLDEQKARWLPASVSGDLIWGLAISEPGAGSDVGERRHHRRPRRRQLRGQRRQDVHHQRPAARCGRGRGQDRSCAHATRGSASSSSRTARPASNAGRHLDKIGQRSQDTAELFFRDVRVPVDQRARAR